MGLFNSIRLGSSGAGGDYEIDRSLRFNDDDSAYLNKTPSSSSNRKTFTISWWFKIGNSGTVRSFFGAYDNSTSSNDSYYFAINIGSDDKLFFAAWNTLWRKTNRVFRDPNAWYHCVLAVDTTQSTGADRVKLYINGVEETSFVNNNNPSQDFDLGWNFSSQMQTIGRVNYLSGSGPYPFDGYIAEVNSIDGLQLTPSSFGETNELTGQWIPKKYVGSYGTNGFYLDFSDNSGTTATTLGKDSSGNSNNFTPNSFATNDAVKDSPTNNFCTFNPLSNYDGLTLAEGNLKATSSSSWKQIRGSIGARSGKWYFEIRCNSIAATEGWIAGIHEMFGRDTGGYYWYSGGYTADDYGYAYGVQDNNQRRTNGGSDDAFSSDVTAGKVVGVRMNLDDNEILISVDGVDKGKMYDIQSGKTYTPAVNLYSSSSATLNCGQDSTFNGEESYGGNTDSGGIGDFAYAVPSGYKALCSANLSEPSIALPNKHFAAFTYTGSGSSGDVVNITNSDVDFTPDLVWVKSRNVTNNHILTDSVRGGSKNLILWTNAEESNTQKVRAFIQNGFESGTDGDTNWPSRSFVAWNWNAGGSTVTNNDGNNTSQVRANTSAGFSIVGYTGTGADNTLVTMGHGLGVKPDAVIIKTRDSVREWVAWINGVGGSATDNQKNLSFSTTAAAGQNSSQFRTSDSTTFTVRDVDSNGNIKVNKSGDDYIAYVFSSVEGYSKFGKYNGNNANDGTFVFTGFRPALLIVKRTDSTTDWMIYDSKRSTFNVIDDFLENTGYAEQTASANSVDFVSNGFKFRNNSGDMNGAGTYVYMAFAESSFKYSRAR